MDVNALFILLSIHALALLSPGPDFAVVTRLSAVNGRMSGIMAALGIATANGIYIAISAIGLVAVLSALPALSTFITYAGVLYLGWLGVKSLLSKGKMPEKEAPINKGKAYVSGFLTSILNPKAMLYFSSVLPQVLKPQASFAATLPVMLLMCMESFLWFSLVSLVFSSARFLQWMKGRLIWFERAVGVVFIVLAVKLAFSVRH